MLRSVYIIRILSGLLLFVFALSITPKRFLHNAFAKHIDSEYKKTNDNPYQFAPSGFNCDNDNLVAESSFEDVLQPLSFPLSPSYRSYIFKDVSFSSVTAIYSHLRGPPVNI